MAHDNSTVGNPMKSRSPAESLKTTVVWVLLIALIIEIGYEAIARYSYHKSLVTVTDILRRDQVAGRKLNAERAASLISGWPLSSQNQTPTGVKTEYHWPSFVWDLRLQLSTDAEGMVETVTIGNNARPFVPQNVVENSQATRKPRGSSATNPAVLGLLLNGDGFAQRSTERSRLIAEIIRQALLMTARDELKCRTRDAVAGEVLPDDDNATFPVVSVTSAFDAERRVEIVVDSHDRGGTGRPVAKFEFQLPQGPLLDVLVARMDAMSVGEFKKSLLEAGYEEKPQNIVADGVISTHAGERLDQFEILSQLEAVRFLHAQIRDEGESAERLAGLARGYAHLYALTRFLWSPVYKVFGARGLLYAERLMRLAGGNSFSLRQRAYVRTLVGLHASALDDLGRAAVADGAASAPDWAAEIEACCRCDAAQLSRLAQDKSRLGRPRLLVLQLAAPSDVSSLRLQAATQMLQAQPDCELAFDVALDQAALGTRRQLTGQSMDRFAIRLRDFLRSADGIPPDIRKAAETKPGKLQAEMRWQAQIVLALRESGQLDRDSNEPSLAVAAQLIEEIDFAQACRLLFLEKYALSIDTRPTLTALKPITTNHRYAGFAAVHAQDEAAAYKAMMEWHAKFDRSELDLAASQVIDVMRRYLAEAPTRDDMYGPLVRSIVEHGDRTYGDLARALRLRGGNSTKQSVAAALREVSPNSSVGAVAAIKYDWDSAQASAAEWEKTFACDVEVQSALAEKYMSLDRFEDAVRCYKRQIELLPDQSAFSALATLYQKNGDEQRWSETLKASLAAPAFGLEHARAHSELAYFHMRRKELEAARPHADLAAQSYSRWGLLCGADFYEKTGDWNAANRLRRASAERYTDSGAAFDWYLWCRSTGHGDVKFARDLAQVTISQLSKQQHSEMQDQLGLYYVLEDRPSDALAAFRQSVRSNPRNDFNHVHAALLADELGDVKLRDEMLLEAYKFGITSHNDSVEVISAFRNCLETGLNRVDLPTIEWAIRSEAPTRGRTTNTLYFVGKFLALRGRNAESRDYLQRAATSSESHMYNCMMAAHALLRAGVAHGVRREDELDERDTRRVAALHAANRLRNQRDWDQAQKAYQSLIDEHPDFADARYERALGYRDHEAFDLAIADLTRAHELIPGCAEFLVTRGQVREYVGEYAGAVEDYEAAIRIERLRPAARYSLAFLLAACPDANFRDGRQALEHARIMQPLVDTPTDLKLALLAAATAESGAFADAIGHQTEALRLAPPLRKELHGERLKLYQRGEAYHRKPEWWRQNK